MKKGKIISLAIVAACILLTGLCTTGYTTDNNASERKLPPAVPEYMVFAGDTIRFDNPGMYERMDRELMAFTYSHQISLLMIKRAPKYFPIIEPILKECGVPDDLKYLMVIESNLDPEARSSSGAAGFWQFMPATAKEYGMEINSTIDERYNIEKATRAACKYLKSSYSRFHDWMTVAASYNAGPNGVSNRISHQKQNSAFNLWLPAETSRYMFRILTAKMMLEDPEAFGFDVRKDDLYKYVEPKKTVSVKGETDLVKLASDNGVTFADLHRANPWIRDIKLKPASTVKEYKIIIPGD